MSRGGVGLGGGAWLEGAHPSDSECSVGAAVVFLLLLKIGLEKVSSLSSVKVGTIIAGALSKRFWGAWATALMLLALSARSFLSIRANMISTKEGKSKLATILKLTPSRVENEKY